MAGAGWGGGDVLDGGEGALSSPPLSGWSKGMSTPGLVLCSSRVCLRLTGRLRVESPLLPLHGKDRSWNKAWRVEQRVQGP